MEEYQGLKAIHVINLRKYHEVPESIKQPKTRERNSGKNKTKMGMGNHLLKA
jgi:hypothetical protein